MRPIKNVFIHIRRVWEPVTKQGPWSGHEDEDLEQCVEAWMAGGLLLNWPLPELSENSATRGMRYPKGLGDLLLTAVTATEIILSTARSEGEVLFVA
jgi:hypothetical protein